MHSYIMHFFMLDHNRLFCVVLEVIYGNKTHNILDVCFRDILDHIFLLVAVRMTF